MGRPFKTHSSKRNKGHNRRNMSKKPCYTCKEPFINAKLNALLDNKKIEAKEYAKKNDYTGCLAIVLLDNQNGYKIVKPQDKTDNQHTAEYLLFNKGVAV